MCYFLSACVPCPTHPPGSAAGALEASRQGGFHSEGCSSLSTLTAHCPGYTVTQQLSSKTILGCFASYISQHKDYPAAPQSFLRDLLGCKCPPKISILEQGNHTEEDTIAYMGPTGRARTNISQKGRFGNRSWSANLINQQSGKQAWNGLGWLSLIAHLAPSPCDGPHSPRPGCPKLCPPRWSH